jgi:hypothetical protein
VVNWAVTPNDSYSAFLTALQSNSSSSIGDAVPCATASSTDTNDQTETTVEGERTVSADVYIQRLLYLLIRLAVTSLVCEASLVVSS